MRQLCCVLALFVLDLHDMQGTSFCDVAVPVPLDATFTYRVGETDPVVGGRVLVPFRAERMVGIVTKLHDNAPQSHKEKKIQIKTVIAALDAEPVLEPGLLKL